jgi:hypothetical protein
MARFRYIAAEPDLPTDSQVRDRKGKEGNKVGTNSFLL